MADISSRLPTTDYADGVAGSAAPSEAILVGGSDGTNLRALSTDSSGDLKVVGNVAAGSSDSGNGVKISGVYETTVPSLSNGQRGDIQLDSRSAVQITSLDGNRATYSAAVTGLGPATAATDIFTITGSSTKTIRVTRIEVSYSQSIYGLNDVQLIKRSTANSGGTSTARTAVSHDSNSTTATATVLSYTANPTLGTAVGTMRSAKLFGQASGEPYAGSQLLEWDFGTRASQAVVLRGTSQVLAVNLNATTVSGGSFDISIEWSEE